jgi:diketogulonate reductase-like aldo/keto reductase
MEDVLAKGKVKAIGVSNWSVPYLEELSKTWKVVPAVNQVGHRCRSKSVAPFERAVGRVG